MSIHTTVNGTRYEVKRKGGRRPSGDKKINVSARIYKSWMSKIQSSYKQQEFIEDAILERMKKLGMLESISTTDTV